MSAFKNQDENAEKLINSLQVLDILCLYIHNDLMAQVK